MLRISEVIFKLPSVRHKKSLNFESYRTSTKLSKEYWQLQELNHKYSFAFKKGDHQQKKHCYLCLTITTTILYYKKVSTNKKNMHLLFILSKPKHNIVF